MIDNILPHSYFRTVLPRLAEELPPVRIFYETKSNLNLEQVQLLRRAGVDRIQPGIEALSSSLLRRMKKGVLARQNLALLRYARAPGLALTWNLLCEFPGDQREDYEATLALIPLIHHLSPRPACTPSASIALAHIMRMRPHTASLIWNRCRATRGPFRPPPTCAVWRTTSRESTHALILPIRSSKMRSTRLSRMARFLEGRRPPPALSLTPATMVTTR